MTTLPPILRDRGNGITTESVGYFIRHQKELGEVLGIEVTASFCKDQKTEWSEKWNTAIIGSRTTMYLSGLNCGYGGEGPHGLHTVFEKLGWNIPLQTIGGTHKLTVTRKMNDEGSSLLVITSGECSDR